MHANDQVEIVVYAAEVHDLDKIGPAESSDDFHHVVLLDVPKWEPIKGDPGHNMIRGFFTRDYHSLNSRHRITSTTVFGL